MYNNILEVKNLKKIYHNENGETIALEDVNFNVGEEEFISIIGPSGCGKSTLLGILAKLLDKSSGDIKYFKDDPTIGYMLQTDALFSWKTVYENCLLGLKIKDKKIKKSTLVDDLLKKYGLWEFRNSYPDDLSGGMRQRVLRILYTHK